jgi:L-fuculose-phosphate aldolase
MASPFTMKKELVQTGLRLYERGMVAGTDGNISVRLDGDRVMVTPSGSALGRLAPEDLLIVDLYGKPLQGKGRPTSELKMHLFVYQNRSDVFACVHSHAPYATAFSVAGIPLAEDILPEIVLFVGNIPLTEYAQPGTDAVPKAIEPHLEKSHAFLLRNHGLLTIGRSLEEAYNRHETVEHFARIVFAARQLGRLDTIPSEDFERLKKIRDRMDEIWGNRV